MKERLRRAEEKEARRSAAALALLLAEPPVLPQPPPIRLAYEGLLNACARLDDALKRLGSLVALL